MNCKPGDLAICLKDSRSQKLAGRMAEVLYFVPFEDFRLPDGIIHTGQGDLPKQDQDIWVVRFSNPVSAVMGRGNPLRSTVYACYPDKYLRPLPGDPMAEDVNADEHRPVSITASQE